MEVSTDGLALREAAKADLPHILALYAHPDMDGRALALADAERVFERLRRCPDHRVYVALKGGRIVGTFTLLVMINLGHMGTPSAIIEDVVVDPALRGQGIGTAMMRFALALARERGCYKATLSSSLRRERAHRFYDSLGFERHGYSFRTFELD